MNSAFALVLLAKASIILCAAGVASYMLRHVSASVRHLTWAVSVFALLCLPIILAVVPALRVPLLPAETTVNAPWQSPPLTVSVTGDSRQSDASRNTPKTIDPSTPAHYSDTSERTLRTNVPVWLWMWSIGALSVLISLIVGRITLARIANNGVAADPRWNDLLAREMKRSRIVRPVRLLQSRAVAAPVTYGAFAPVILLPVTSDTWDAERRTAVMRHELAHVARMDALTQLAAALACAIYWFHPGAWYAAARLRTEREIACDDIALADSTSQTDYADHLLAIARAAYGSGFHAHTAVSMSAASQLEKRLRSILDTHTSRGAISHAKNRMIIGATFCATIGLAAFTAVRKPGAGELVITGNTPTCATCRITLRRVVRLGGDADSVFPNPTTQVAYAAATGRYFTSNSVGRGRIAVYSSTGKFEQFIDPPGAAGHAYARFGIEPFTGDSVLVQEWTGDSVFIFAGNGSFGRGFTLPKDAGNLHAFNDGALVISPSAQQHPGGRTFRLTDATGRIASSFVAQGFDPKQTREQFGMHDGDGRSNFWISGANEYRMQLVGRDGNALTSVRRNVDWFETYDRQGRVTGILTPSKPLISGVWSDENHRLWTSVERSDAAWKPGKLGDPDATDLNKVFDTVVEVLDLNRKKLVASRRFDSWLKPVGGARGVLFSVGITDSGKKYVDVFEPVLEDTGAKTGSAGN